MALPVFLKKSKLLQMKNSHNLFYQFLNYRKNAFIKHFRNPLFFINKENNAAHWVHPFILNLYIAASDTLLCFAYTG